MKDLTADQKKALYTSWAISLAIGYAMWKFGPGNLIKAAGAGVIGTTAVGAARTVAGV